VPLTVIWNMVVKPAGQGGWFWSMFLVMILGVAAVIALYVRGEQQVPVPAAE
jgi:hypothetical protein